MPEARRREIRRWRVRRAHRRRRVRLVGAAGILVVALALVLAAAPGAYAPTGEVSFALISGDMVGRVQDVGSRSAERSPDAPPTEPVATTSAPSPEPPPSPAAEAAAPPAPAADAGGAQPDAAPAPEPQAAPRAPAAPSDKAGAMSAEIIVRTNAERAAAGLPELAYSACATDQAAARSALLVAEGRFEHDPLGPILDACGSGTVGENLSLGYASAQAAMVGWMNSPGHRENILRTSFSEIGVACATGQRGWLCAQVFLG